MYTIDSDSINGTIVINGDFSSIINKQNIFTYIDETLTILIKDLNGIEKFKSFSYDADGIRDTRYLSFEYRLTRDFKKYTDWYKLNESIINFPIYNPSEVMNMELRIRRVGDNPSGIIVLNSYELKGNLERPLFDTSNPTIHITPENNQVVLRSPYIYKVFKVIDYEILSRGNVDNITIKYRYSQDNGRTTTKWEPFTKENITTTKISPIRFFQIEYLIEGDGNSEVKIFDINIIGDIQNVSKDYEKTNLIGIREDCNCLILGIIDGTLVTDGSDALSGLENSSDVNYGSGTNNNLLTSGCVQGGGYVPLSDENKASLYNPYQAANNALAIYNNTNNKVNEMFGHEVLYIHTDPDNNGTDYTLHEYQLKNYACEAMLKVSVENNSFPDNQMTHNMFDLALFESFEVHIPKNAFKDAFGIEKRPRKDDVLWFCRLNIIYQVEHSQQQRSFNNSAIQYKLILKKFTQKANIKASNALIDNTISELTRNSTIEELYGDYHNMDVVSTANKENIRPLTHDTLRLDVNCAIESEILEADTMIISKNNYNLSTVKFEEDAVIYRNIKEHFKVSDNMSYSSWFSLYNYIEDEVYNMFNYYNDNKGIRIDLLNESIRVKYNDMDYIMDLTDIDIFDDAIDFLENKWYAYHVDIEQRQGTIKQYLYRIEEDRYGKVDNLELLLKQEDKFKIGDFELEDINASILGSDMSITNIRLYNNIIEEKYHSKTLLSNIVGDDSRYLIFADNANPEMKLDNSNLSDLNGRDYN